MRWSPGQAVLDNYKSIERYLNKASLAIVVEQHSHQATGETGILAQLVFS